MIINKKYEKQYYIVLRKVGEFFFLINPKVSYNSENDNIFQTDEMGACIWNCIGEGGSLDEIVIRVLACLNDEKTDSLVDTVENDIAEFLRILLNQQYIREVC